MTSVLVVSEIFWPEGGGAERATQLIVELLVRQGFDVSVVTGTRNPFRVPGVKYYITPYLRPSNRVTMWTLIRLLERNREFLNLLKKNEVLYIPLSAYPLISLAKRNGLRVVVHVHNYMPVRYTGVKYYFEPDVVKSLEEAKLAVFHEFYVHKSLWRTLAFPASYLLYNLAKCWFAQADKIICVSRRQAELLVKSIPHVAGKVVIVYNPLPGEFLKKEPKNKLDDKPTFIYAGGGNLLKGFHMVLKALKSLSNEKIHARFILTGNYSVQDVKLLKLLAHKYRNIEVQLKGRVRFEELMELYEQSWALLAPSIWEEPLPYVIFESLLSETLPIATKVGGIAEVLESIGGERFMIQPGDVAGLVSIIKGIVKSDLRDIVMTAKELRRSLLDFYKFHEYTLRRKLLEIFSSQN